MNIDDPDSPPTEAGQTLADLLNLTPPADYVFDPEARGREYLAEAKKRDAIGRFNATCPDDYKQSDWSNPALLPYMHAIERVKSWQNGPLGIIASGPTGRGKTRAISELYRRLSCDEGLDVRFWYAGDWFSSLQQEIRYGRDDAKYWVENCAKHKIVILDDLGQEAVTTARAEWAAAWFFRFLDLRIGAKLPLIVSTNLTANQIAGEHSAQKGIRHEPLIRRLLELGEVVKFEERLTMPLNLTA